MEVELTGNIAPEELLFVLYQDNNVRHKLLRADLEDIEGSSFGKLLLHLQGNKDENDKALSYFFQNNIQHSIKGYA